MEIVNLTEKENLLLRRKEIIINLKANSTPSRPAAKMLIAKKFSVSEDNIRVKKIDGRFGSNDFILVANIYKSKEDKEATEIVSKKERENETKAFEAAKEVQKEKQEETTE